MDNELQVLSEARYRYENYLKEADHERLAHEARLNYLTHPNRPFSNTIPTRLLVWLGKHMTVWGAFLVERYDPGRVNSNRQLNHNIQTTHGC
ncbi:MAG TPA: hypothetical protein VN363_00060 [Anaerolineales bacterium]|nr:hypothetical protein [Anaerolineales bacterium]